MNRPSRFRSISDVFLFFVCSGLFIYLIFTLLSSRNEDKSSLILSPVSEIYAKNIYQNIIKSSEANAFIEKIMLSESSYRNNVKASIDELQSSISSFCKQNKPQCTNLFLEHRIKRRINRDIKILSNLKKKQSSNMRNLDSENSIKYSRYMLLSIGQSLQSTEMTMSDFSTKKDSVARVIRGGLANDYNLLFDNPPICGGIEGVSDIGTIKLNASILGLLYVTQELFDSSGNPIVDIRKFADKFPSVVYKLPLDTEGKKLFFDSGLEQYSFFQGGEIFFVHNGYEGGIGYAKDIVNNEYVMDSISWGAKLMNINQIVTSLDLMSVHNDALKSGFVTWNKDRIGIKDTLNHLINPVAVTSIEDVRPGMLFSERYFNDRSDIGYQPGIGGYIGLVLGSDTQNDKFFTLAHFGSNEPYHKSGFCISIHNYKEENAPKVKYFFNINESQVKNNDDVASSKKQKKGKKRKMLTN